jgi:TPR repeat protein
MNVPQHPCREPVHVRFARSFPRRIIVAALTVAVGAASVVVWRAMDMGDDSRFNPRQKKRADDAVRQAYVKAAEARPSVANDSERTGEVARLLQLADSCIKADGKTPDWETAFKTYEDAAKMGSGYAAFRMGQIAERKLLSAVDPKASVSFYEKAVTLGYIEGNASLARLFIEGQIVAADTARALAYADAGITAGSTESAYLKGALLLDGKTTKDAGIDLLLRAAEAGNASAQLTLGRIYRDGSYLDRDRAQAQEWMQLAAARGSTLAQAELAALLGAKIVRNPENVTMEDWVNRVDAACRHGSWNEPAKFGPVKLGSAVGGNCL